MPKRDKEIRTDSIDQPTGSLTDPGRQMRSRLLDVATRMFKAKGLAAVSVSAVANAAQAFPSQVTYYFRTKDAMFVEAACREMLYVAQAAEKASKACRSARTYLESLARSTLGQPGLSMFVEALVLTRRQPALQPLIARTIERLHHEGERAFTSVREARGWKVDQSDAVTAQRFWALVMALCLRNEALGIDARTTQNEVIRLLSDDFIDVSLPGPTGLHLIPGTKESAHGRRRAG
jgi:AcrR family transcriptional regulator